MTYKLVKSAPGNFIGSLGDHVTRDVSRDTSRDMKKLPDWSPAIFWLIFTTFLLLYSLGKTLFYLFTKKANFYRRIYLKSKKAAPEVFSICILFIFDYETNHY